MANKSKIQESKETTLQHFRHYERCTNLLPFLNLFKFTTLISDADGDGIILPALGVMYASLANILMVVNLDSSSQRDCTVH
jgi:hypothetical protein